MQSQMRFLGENKEYIKAIGITVMHDLIENDFPMHTHDFYETFIILGGSAKHVQGNTHYTLSKGDVFSIKGDIAHGFVDVHDMDIINLEYIPGFFERPYSEIRSIPGFDAMFLVLPELLAKIDNVPTLKLDDKGIEYVKAVSDFLIDLQKQGDPSCHPVLRMNFEALIGYLATQYDSNSPLSSVNALSHVMSFIEKNISQPITIKDIANDAFLSPRQLQRLFQKYYKQTPMQYLQDMRMRNALTMLLKQKVSISEAARHNGFDDASYFTRVFHAYYGITPRDAVRLIYKGLGS